MKKNKLFNAFFLFGVPFIFIVGSLFHFAYDFTNQNPIVGLFTPINESIWEHTKLVFFPTVIWYILYFTLSRGIKKPSKKLWLTSCLISAVLGVISVPMIFYFYTQAFGIELLIIDVLILFVATLLGQAAAYHGYKYSFSIKKSYVYTALIIITILYFIFTVNPPYLPIFLD